MQLIAINLSFHLVFKQLISFIWISFFVCLWLWILRINKTGQRKIDGSLLSTSGPVVATVPDCIRVTMVLPDIFGLALSQRTWLNLHTCTQAHRYTHAHTHTQAERHRDAVETPALREYLFQAWLEAERLEDLLSLSTYFLGSSLSFPPGTPLFFLHLTLPCLRNLWITLTVFFVSKPVAFG